MNLDEAKTQLQDSKKNIDFIREIQTEAIANEQLWITTVDSLLGKLKQRDYLIMNLNAEIKTLKATLTQKEADLNRLTSKEGSEEILKRWAEEEEHDG